MSLERVLYSTHYKSRYPSMVERYRRYRDRRATSLDASLRNWRKSLAGYERSCALPYMGRDV